MTKAAANDLVKASVASQAVRVKSAGGFLFEVNMGLYNAKLAEVVRLVNLWNHEYALGLEFRGATDDYAAWLIGNCAVALAQIALSVIRFEIDDYTWIGCSQETQATGARLARLFDAHFSPIELRNYPPGETERMAQKTLAHMHDNFDYDQILARADLDAEARAQIEAKRDARDARENERARRKQLTAEDWLQEFFGAPAPTEQPTWRGNGAKRKGRQPEYSFETMALAVIEWRELLAQPRGATDLNLGEDDMLDDAPAKRTTKIEFLSDKFNNGELGQPAVTERKFDYWQQQFDKGAWEIPKKHKKRYEKLKKKKE